MPEEITAPPSTPEEQVEWWMDRYFKLLDEHAVAVNALAQIQAIVSARIDGYHPASCGPRCRSQHTDDHSQCPGYRDP